MATTSNLAAFIIGSGAHIGAAVASKLREQGYKIALGSRGASAQEKTGADLHVQVDASKRESIELAFDTIEKALGPVNVVIYNAASLATPPNPTHVLSLSTEAYYESAALGLGVFTAAKRALNGFRSDVHISHPKVFIVTGNILPFFQYSPPEWHTLGVQKAIEARLIATASETYKADNIRFHFASLVSPDGGVPDYGDFLKSAETHAKVYWSLIDKSETSYWDYRFTLEGKHIPSN